MLSNLLTQFKLNFQKEHICHKILMENQEFALLTMDKFFGTDVRAKTHIHKQIKLKNFQKMSFKCLKEKLVQV